MSERTAEDILDSLDGQISKLIRQAYDAGFKDGHDDGFANGFLAGNEAMRKLIMDVAIAPAQPTPGIQPSLFKAEAHSSARFVGRAVRAPRGSVRAAIKAVLRDRADGMTEGDIGAAVAALDTAVSAKSVGAELRRNVDDLYRNDSGKWFLIAQPGELETAEDTPSAVPAPSATKEESDAPETAIAT